MVCGLDKLHTVPNVFSISTASGGIVPPFVVYPLQRISKEMAQSVPDDWGIGRSDSGWMTSATFLE